LILEVSKNAMGFAPGSSLFGILKWMSFPCVCLAGVFLTSDCLSEEKREGTLGLLFLTELKGYDVVFGKLVGTSLHSIYGLLAILPLLALPLLMGGVTSGEFWRVAMVLALTLFLTLSIGMFVSALARETRQVMSATLLVIVFISGLLPLFWWVQTLFSSGASREFLLWASPAYLYTRSFDHYWRNGAGAAQFWNSFVTILMIAAGAFFTACYYLPQAWHEKGESPAQGANSGWQYRYRFGSPAIRAACRGRLENNPFYWLSRRDRLPGTAAKVIISFLFLIWIGCYVGCHSSNFRIKDTCFGIVMFLGYGIHQILKTLMTIETSRRLSDDRQSGALELLLVTPLPISKILSGQRRALREIYRWPTILAGLVNLCMFLLIVGKNPMGMHGDDRVIFCEIFIGGAILLPLDAFALSWIGMAMAMKKRGHHRAIYSTLARIMLPPWLAILLFVFLGIGGTHMNSADMIGFVGLWLFGCLMLNIIQTGAARVALASAFRETAGQRNAPVSTQITAKDLTSSDRGVAGTCLFDSNAEAIPLRAIPKRD
jgi:ABC-type transport system involved in multi-copper enzyme maturation permease subunit